MNEIETNIENIDLSAPAPAEEPMRQYYFIKVLKSFSGVVIGPIP